jgi:uncharacterized protein YxeA
MKHTFTIIICSLLIIITTAVAYSMYRLDRAESQVTHQREMVAQQNSIIAHQTAIANQTAHIKAECEKETTYYNLLTTHQKATVAVPDCTMQVVE